MLCLKHVCYEKVPYVWYMLEILFIWSLCLKIPYVRYFNLTHFIFPMTWLAMRILTGHHYVSFEISGAGHKSASSLTMVMSVSKDVGKDWNNHFIAFIPFLCGLILEFSHHLSSICSLVYALLCFFFPAHNICAFFF